MPYLADIDMQIEIDPPHEVKWQNKHDEMVEIIKSGGKLPPVLVADKGDYYQAYSGSHRIAAYKTASEQGYGSGEPEFYVLSERDEQNALDHMGVENIDDAFGDFESFWVALRATGADVGNAVE